MNHQDTLSVTGTSLTIADVGHVARHGRPATLAESARAAVQANRNVLEEMIAAGETLYGVTTGVGEFARIPIRAEESAELQRRVIRSHAAAVGEPLAEEVVRGTLLLRVNSLARGYSGIRLELLDQLLAMLNHGVHPIIPSQGSLGCSGDLAPLAHLALVVIGEGEAVVGGDRLPGNEALARVGCEPLTLSYKEALGLINGTQVITCYGSLALLDLQNAIDHAVLAAAMTFDAIGTNSTCFDNRAHTIRGHAGQIEVATQLRALLTGSQMIPNNQRRVQDAYALRCTPQILGPSRDAWNHARDVHETEINAVSDNPLFFTDERLYIPAGNFHGQPIAMAQDYLALAAAEVGSLAERQTNRLLNPQLSGLPDFLVTQPGLNSGLMIAQYTQAALTADNRVLAHPAVTDNVPVSADQEDHVCMGDTAARKLRTIVANVEQVLAIQLVCAAQAMELRRPLRGGEGTERALTIIRQHISPLTEDRVLAADFATALTVLRSGVLIEYSG